MYYFVLFKAEWCGHCQQFKLIALPKVSECIKKHNDIMKLAIVDADENDDIVKNQGVEGFPTIRIYQGGAKNPFQKVLVEFQKRDPEHIVKVIDGFAKKIKGGAVPKPKQENFIPMKSVSYSSYYTNYNGKENKEENEIVCENGICKRKNRIINEHGQVKEIDNVVPYNDYANGFQEYYDVALELRNHF